MNLEGSFVEDIALYLCCGFCSGMQDINEVKDKLGHTYSQF